MLQTRCSRALDAGDTATDVFNYTVSDGTATDIATITITILGAEMRQLHKMMLG